MVQERKGKRRPKPNLRDRKSGKELGENDKKRKEKKKKDFAR